MIAFSVGYLYELFLFFMNSMFTTKRAKLLEFQTLRMQLLILGRRIIPTPAGSGRTLKFHEFSHKRLNESTKKN